MTIQIEREALLPCPFCGCEEVESITDDGAHWNKCKGCGATGPMTTRYSGEEGEEYASWQSRPRYTALLLEASEIRKHNSALLSSQPSAPALPVEAIQAAIYSLEEQKIVLGMFRSIPETVNSATNGRAAIERHIEALSALLPTQGDKA